MIEPVAAILGIDKKNIYANRILFDVRTHRLHTRERSLSLSVCVCVCVNAFISLHVTATFDLHHYHSVCAHTIYICMCAYVFLFGLVVYSQSTTGAYAGFDEKEYTSESGGKARALQALKAEFGFATIAMVGDGATDAEAKQPGGADIFIGYGGNVEREAVKKSADWYVYTLNDMTRALDGDDQ